MVGPIKAKMTYTMHHPSDTDIWRSHQSVYGSTNRRADAEDSKVASHEYPRYNLSFYTCIK